LSMPSTISSTLKLKSAAHAFGSANSAAGFISSRLKEACLSYRPARSAAESCQCMGVIGNQAPDCAVKELVGKRAWERAQNGKDGKYALNGTASFRCRAP
jgi:hypothetical protein